MDPSFAIFAVCVFVAVALAIEGLHQVWSSRHSAAAKRLAARLQAIDSGGVEAVSTLERLKPKNQWAWIEERVLGALPNGPRLLHYVETSGTGKTAGGMV